MSHRWGRKQAKNDPTGSVGVDELPAGIPRPSKRVIEGLALIRPDMHLRYNPTATGVFVEAEYGLTKIDWQGLYEVWDRNPEGRLYGPIYTVTDGTEHDGFAVPGYWLIEALNYINPDRWDWDLEKMARVLVHDKNKSVRRAARNKRRGAIRDLVYNVVAHAMVPKVGVLK